MKRIGLVGGMSPESTKDYYGILIDLARERLSGEHVYPEVVIFSVNMSDLLRLMKSGETDQAIQYLVDMVGRLGSAGADIAAMTANTVHIYYEAVAEEASLPMVSIVDSTFHGAQRIGCRKALLLGTKYTMEAEMFPRTFKKGGIEVMVPGEEDREYIDQNLGDELTQGIIRPETKERYIDICNHHIEKYGTDAVILGCTEIPLLLKDGDLPVPLLNTTRLHAEELFKMATGK